MGQGYSSAALPAGPSAIEASELSDLTFERPLGGARFLRTVRARHQQGVVVVKVCLKSNPTVSFKQYSQALKRERLALKDVPNVLAYSRIRETNTLGVLVRQFVHNSLYDRISIRPFLENIEKKWIAFQILCAVRDCHSRGVFHGDIKSENVMVTSWGWVFLTDFASTFKPVYLPEDNPADFSFYYDTSARRTCYLAPERFLAAGQQPQEANIVQWNMDIFSVGCVLAELFTESPTFTLSQLFRYRKKEYDPTASLLSKLDDEHVRNLISNMILLDPSRRCQAQDYLDDCKGKAFPIYFYNHLHTLMQEITDPSSGRKSHTASETNNGESDDRIDRIYDDFEMLSASLEYSYSQPGDAAAPTPLPHLRSLFPLQVDVPNSRHVAHAAYLRNDDNGTFILLNVITSSIRSSARAASKVRGCELLLAFAERIPDEAKLDRVLPYVIPLLDDSNEMVLIAAVRTMTQLLALVTVVSPVNSFVFTQYIFPRLSNFIMSPGFRSNTLVRATYAACLGTLAQTASRFLDMMQALRAGNLLPSADESGKHDGEAYLTSQDSYDETRQEVLNQFEAHTKVFLTDTENSVRRSFLTSVSSLCVFFGETMASDVILSHLNTYLNDQDWLLKCAFFRTIVGVAVYIGSANLEEYILPLMLQALTDPQEFVIEQALRSLGTMAEIGLLQRAKTWELIDTVARFEMHPNMWIKEAASHFVSAAATYLSMSDIRILVIPLIQPYLKFPIGNLTESELLDALKKPLPRQILELALQWAKRVDKGTFWRPAKESRQLSYRATSQMPPQSSVADFGPKALAKIPKTVEDDQWLGRLRSAGMQGEDEMKVLAFREYLWRSAQRTKRDHKSSDLSYEHILELMDLKITPQTVIFDMNVQAYEQHLQQQDRTIAEALEEASNPSKTESTRALSSGAPAEQLQLNFKPGSNPIRAEAITGQPHRLSKQASGSLSSSPSSGIGPVARDVENPVRRRTKDLALLGGPNKAAAEVATDDATAAGRLSAPQSVSRRTSPAPMQGHRPQGIHRAASHNRAVHNYTGNDPTVLKLLDAVYVDNFPIDAADFGPFVQRPTGSILVNSSQPSAGLWRPQGQLVAVLNEHTAKVSRIVPSPDHLFFATASDDGSVKIWDTRRLESNVTHRSRQTYRLAAGVRVTSLCFIEGTHSFICTGSDGSVHAVRVDVTELNNSTKYGKLRVIREWQIPSSKSPSEHAVWSEHFRGETSTLILATNLCRVLALDLRYMSIIFEIHNPPSHGEPTCFCMNRRHEWLLLGTSHGVLDLYDLRFQLRLRSWIFPGAAPISRLQNWPGRKNARRNRFCVSSGTARGEVSLWDLEKAICLEVIRPAHPSRKDRLHIRDYELKNLDDDRPEKALDRIVGSAVVDANKAEQNTDSPGQMICAFMGIQPSPNNDPDRMHPFVITGGPDGKVRFFDIDRLEGCRLVSGSLLDEKPDEKPTYTFSQLNLDTKVLTEKAPTEDKDKDASGNAVESNRVASPASKRHASSSTATKQLPARYDAIRLSAQRLLNGHLDTVTDVAMIERPFGMVLSADRNGTVFVHQ